MCLEERHHRDHPNLSSPHRSNVPQIPGCVNDVKLSGHIFKMFKKLNSLRDYYQCIHITIYIWSLKEDSDWYCLGAERELGLGLRTWNWVTQGRKAGRGPGKELTTSPAQLYSTRG